MEILSSKQLCNKTRVELKQHLKEVHHECAARVNAMNTDPLFTRQDRKQLNLLMDYKASVKSILTHKEHTNQR